MDYKTDRSTIITIAQTVEEILDVYMITKLKCHDYITKMRAVLLVTLRIMIKNLMNFSYC